MQRNGAALLVDQGKSVRLWQNDQDAIEIALRLAQQKVEPVLLLSGPSPLSSSGAADVQDRGVQPSGPDPDSGLEL